MSTTYGISDLAREFDITTRTLRFYEEKGYLKPKRQGTRRIYSPSDRTRLRLILRGRRIGFSLDESADIVLMYDSSGSDRKQLQKLITGIKKKQAELKTQQQDIEYMLLDLQDVEKNCVNALAEISSQKKVQKEK